MKLDEAIKLLQKEARHYHYLPDHKKEESTRLGIEALKYIKYLRTIAAYRTFSILPGETEE